MQHQVLKSRHARYRGTAGLCERCGASQSAGASQLTRLGESHKQPLFGRELFRNPSYKTVFAKGYTAAVYLAE